MQITEMSTKALPGMIGGIFPLSQPESPQPPFNKGGRYIALLLRMGFKRCSVSGEQDRRPLYALQPQSPTLRRRINLWQMQMLFMLEICLSVFRYPLFQKGDQGGFLRI